MSEESIGLVRSICADWARGDYRSNQWAHPEIRFVSADGPSPGERTGLSGMAEGWRASLDAWEDFQQEVEEYRQLDEERVLVLFRVSGRGRASGVDLARTHDRIAGVFHITDGLVTKFVGYFDPQRAFADLGLRE